MGLRTWHDNSPHGSPAPSVLQHLLPCRRGVGVGGRNPVIPQPPVTPPPQAGDILLYGRVK